MGKCQASSFILSNQKTAGSRSWNRDFESQIVPFPLSFWNQSWPGLPSNGPGVHRHVVRPKEILRPFLETSSKVHSLFGTGDQVLPWRSKREWILARSLGRVGMQRECKQEPGAPGWVQSVTRFGQVMIFQSVGSSPAAGSVLAARSLLQVLCLPPSAPHPLKLCLSLKRQINIF